MTSTNHFDRVRAYVLGQMSEREVFEFERVLAASPELAEFERQWRALQGPTRRIDVELAESALEFSTLERALAAERSSWIRRAASIAAAALIAAAASWWFLRSDAPRIVKLDSIVLETAPTLPDDFPVALVDYQPVVDGQIRWISSLDEGQRLARAAERPLLLFGSHPTCPWCLHMKEHALKDEGVLAMLDQFVAVQVDYSTKPIEEVSDIFARGWPVLEVQTFDGTIAHRFPGVHEAPEFRAHLSSGLDAIPRSREAATWNQLHDAAQRYAEARDDENARRYGDAYNVFVELDRNGPDGLAQFAADGLRRIADAARERLLSARSAASATPDAVEGELSRAVLDFASTPFADDFARVLESWRDDGGFPVLADANG